MRCRQCIWGSGNASARQVVPEYRFITKPHSKPLASTRPSRGQEMYWQLSAWGIRIMFSSFSLRLVWVAEASTSA